MKSKTIRFVSFTYISTGYTGLPQGEEKPMLKNVQK